MVAIAIGLALVAGLLMAMLSTMDSSRSNERTSEIQSDGRFALNLVKQELRQAGYRGYTWASPNSISTSLGAISGECGDGTGLFVSNLRQAVWGLNDGNPFSGNCIPDKVGAAGGDVLVVRLLDGTPVATPVANTLYFRSTYNAGEIFRGTTFPSSIGAELPIANFALKTSVYYVRPYTTSAAEIPLVPALMRVVVMPNGSMAQELVATGIEEFQVQYGRTNTASSIQYFDGFSTVNCPDCILDANSTVDVPTVWDEVNSVRIWMLSRSSTPEPGYSNTSSYVMGDKTVSVADGFRRQLFSSVIELRN
jgi:type IV pilus assembly protein PilW